MPEEHSRGLVRAEQTAAVARLVRQLGLSADEAAEIAGIDPERMRRIIDGDGRGLTIERMDRIIEALDPEPWDGPNF